MLKTIFLIIKKEILSQNKSFRKLVYSFFTLDIWFPNKKVLTYNFCVIIFIKIILVSNILIIDLHSLL